MRALNVGVAALALAWAGGVNAQAITFNFSSSLPTANSSGPSGAAIGSAIGAVSGLTGSFTVNNAPIVNGSNTFAIAGGTASFGSISVNMTGGQLYVYSSNGQFNYRVNAGQAVELVAGLPGSERVAVSTYSVGSGSITSLQNLATLLPTSGTVGVGVRSDDYTSSYGYSFAGPVSLSLAPAGGLGGGALPEPATWAMMILGVGAAGYSLRRRQQRVTLAYS